MKVITKIAKLERMDNRIIGIAVGVSYVVGILIAYICMHTGGGEASYVPIGAVMAAAAGVVFHLIIRVGCFARNFNLAISMGTTRRAFVTGYQLLAIAELLLLAFGICILYQLESVFAELLFGVSFATEVFNGVFRMHSLIPILLVIWSLEFLVEAVTMRFGEKAWWTIWIIWMSGWIGVPRLLKNDTRGIMAVGIKKVKTALFAEGVPLFAVCGVILVLAFALAAWKLLRKQQVTN